MTTTPRSLEVRLTEYRDALANLADFAERAAEQIAAVGGDTGPLDDALKIYRIIADDLTTIMAGEELERHVISMETDPRDPS